MNEEIRQMINKVKNFKQLSNDGIEKEKSTDGKNKITTYE